MDSFARLLDATARCLCRYENLVGSKSVVAAVSGGADSTALALCLHRLSQQDRLPGSLLFCHVDHAVRPDSGSNAEHVMELGRRLSVPVRVLRLQRRAGRPSEDDLRTRRYQALLQCAREQGAGMVLTAHHADDNMETVLFRMLRGTGPRGLAGIPEARWLCWKGERVLLVRPFLELRRATLRSLCEHFGERVYEDSTNRDLGYSRNRLRLETIPRLQQRMGSSLDVTLMSVVRTARAAAGLMEAQGLRLLSERARQRLSWRLELDLDGLPGSTRPFLEEALRQAHVELDAGGLPPLRGWLDRALDLLRKPDGKRLGGRKELWVERTRRGLLLVDPERAGPPPAGGPGQRLLWDAGRQQFGATEWWLEATVYPQPPLNPSPREAGPYRALLDPRLLPQPWRLRCRKPGDRFQPLGMKQDVELRRFLQSRHVPRFDRDRLPLLVDRDDRVLWVPGVEVSEIARLRLNTRRTVEVWAHLG
jgi:tRNA(Ile)-lysidine synthase